MTFGIGETPHRRSLKARARRAPGAAGTPFFSMVLRRGRADNARRLCWPAPSVRIEGDDGRIHRTVRDRPGP